MRIAKLFISILSFLFISSAYGYGFDFLAIDLGPIGEAPKNCASKEETKKPSPNDMQFYSQYDNHNNPGGTCQNTSIAMVAKYLQPNKNKSLTPDKVFANQGGNSRGKSPGGAAAILKEYGVKYAKSTYNANIDDLKYQLSQGRPAIVNGYFTDGHVVVVTDYDPKTDEFIVNDPAGKWNEKYMGGYPRAGVGGKQARYKASAFTKTVMPGGPGDLWMAVGSNEDFNMKAPKGFKYPKKEKEVKVDCNVASNGALNRGQSADTRHSQVASGNTPSQNGNSSASNSVD
jgi:hypothetical protein